MIEIYAECQAISHNKLPVRGIDNSSSLILFIYHLSACYVPLVGAEFIERERWNLDLGCSF